LRPMVLHRLLQLSGLNQEPAQFINVVQNCSSRREEALIKIRNPKSEIRNTQSLLTSAPTIFQTRSEPSEHCAQRFIELRITIDEHLWEYLDVSLGCDLPSVRKLRFKPGT